MTSHRFVHHRDIMPRVPPFGWYEDAGRGDYVHVGTVKYIDVDSRS